MQRRHQKIVEESPSPLAERLPGLRERLGEAAVAAARAVGYTGAGTVEFVADGEGRFYFLEMNTRLQVEHPVTEARTGLDLVRLQLRTRRRRPAAGIATGGRRPCHRGPALRRGSGPGLATADRDAAPLRRPRRARPASSRWPDGLRLDSAVARRVSRSSPHYDPMLAKLICAGADRQQVARRLAAALAGARIHGLPTNRDLLVRVLRHPTFLRRRRRHQLPAGRGRHADRAAGRRAGRAAVGAGRRAGRLGRPAGADCRCRPECPAAGATWRPSRNGSATGAARPAPDRLPLATDRP